VRNYIVLALISAVTASSAIAQTAPSPTKQPRPSVNTHAGFRSSISLLRGSSQLTSADFDETQERTAGWADNYSLGYYINRSISIDADVSTLYGSVDAGKQRDYNLLVGLTAYPSETNGFYVSGAVGRSRTVATIEGETLEVTGAAYSIAAGFDIPIKPEFSLSPFLRYMGTTGGSLFLDGSKLGDVNVNQVQLGVALRWH
jgi:hypothetical protein